MKGLAAGQATLTANLQGFMADATVTVVAGVSLPPGTVRWSVPPSPGFATMQIVQAAPAENAPDVYAIEAGPSGEVLVRAFSVDGRQRWQTLASTSPSEFLIKAVSSSTGGLLLQFQGSSFIKYLEPQSGQPLWRYDSPEGISTDWAVHPKGSIFFAEGLNDLSTGTLSVRLTELSEATGTLVNTIALPNSTFQLTNNDCITGANQSSSNPPQVGPPMVDEDGTVRLQVAVTQYAADGSVCGHQAITSSTTLSLLQIPLSGAAGFVTVQTLGAGGFDVVDIPTAIPAETIPDGAGGVLAGWTYMTSSSSTLETRISRLSPAGNAQYTLPLANWTFPSESMVLGENGVAFATDSQQVVSFNLADGSINWSRTAPAGSLVQLVMATAGNGLVIKTTDFSATANPETVSVVDNQGQGLPESWSGTNLQFVAASLWFSRNSLDAIEGPAPEWPESPWPEPNNDNNRSSERRIKVMVYKVNEANLLDSVVSTRVRRGLAYWTKFVGILFDWNGQIAGMPACPSSNPGCTESDPLNILIVGTGDNATLQHIANERFPERTGIFMLFTRSTGAKADAITLGIPGSLFETTIFLNIIVFNNSNLDIEAHEMGHVFQLQHLPLATLNLMCGNLGFPILDDFTFCFPSSVSKFITEFQRVEARKAAQRLY